MRREEKRRSIYHEPRRDNCGINVGGFDVDLRGECLAKGTSENGDDAFWKSGSCDVI